MSGWLKAVVKLAWAGALLASVLACQGGAERPQENSADSSATDSRVVASTHSGTITIADIDRFIGRLGSAYQPDPKLSVAERYRELARRLALEQLLLEEAHQVGADLDPEVETLDRDYQKLVYSQHYINVLAAPEPITEEQLRQHFAASQARFDRDEKRRVSHIFMRHAEDGDRQATRERLEVVRQQIQRGRPFELMAREHSDSETRHQGGVLGFVERGMFPPDFDRVVFSLAPEVPSEVFVTADGAHIFYVHNVLEARDVDFDDIRELLRRELQIERRFERLRQAAADLPRPEDALIADQQQILELLRGAHHNEVILRLGEYQLTVGQLREQTQVLARQLGDLRDTELPLRLFDELQYREIIYQHMLSREQVSREQEGESFAVPQARLAAARRRQVIDHYSQRKMKAWLTRDPDHLEQYRAEHAMRFTSPLRLELQRLAVPLGENGTMVMARLERARDVLDRGELTLDTLAEELGGRVRRIGPVSIAQLRDADSSAVRFAALLHPGEYSPPYLAGDGLAMFTVIERVEPEPRPLAEVRDLVIEDYLEHHAARVFQEIADEMLAAVDFEIHQQVLRDLAIE